jgi:hypothetical protein
MEALKEEPDYLIVNHDVYDAGLERCLKRDNLGTVSDEDFSTLDACLNRIDAMAMSYISMWVGRREFFNRITEEKYRYFAQWGMSIQADRYFGVNRFPTGKLISTPSLRARQNTDFNEEAYFCCFLHGSAEVFRYTEEAGVLSSDACRARRSLLLRRHALKRIRFERRTGIFARRKTYEMLRSDYGDLGVFWLLCVPMMYMPGVGSLLKLARRLLGRSEA